MDSELPDFLGAVSPKTDGDPALFPAAPLKKQTLEIDGWCALRIESEFWTPRQRQAHSLHEISYRACFKPQLPRFFIDRMTEPGDCVFDPFMGRGTTLIEAALQGRRVAGNDVNPLSRILTEPRLFPPEPTAVRERLKTIPWNPKAKADIDLTMFYSPTTEGHLVSLKQYLERRHKDGTEDGIDRWIRMVATNRLTGHSPGFFSVYTMPPNQAVSQEAQRKINIRRNQTPPDRDVPAIIDRKTRSLLRHLNAEDRKCLKGLEGTAQFTHDDAAALKQIPDNSVDLVVTSPPFLNVVQYPEDNWLRCWFNAIDARVIAPAVTMETTLEGWASFMFRVLKEIHRILQPGGWVAFEVGEIRKGHLLLDETIGPLGTRAGLQCEIILVNRQQFTKTSNCWGVENNKLGTNTNRIVVFRK